MSQQPYLATFACFDWPSLHEWLKTLAEELTHTQTLFWSILETPFELKLGRQTLTLPTSSQTVGRGRLFWPEGEIRFRLDTSHPRTPYRLVLTADQPLKISALTNSEAATADLPDNNWHHKRFERFLWGEPYGDLWYTTRIPTQLDYKLPPTKNHRPIVEGIGYYRLGRLEFYRFTTLNTKLDESKAASSDQEQE